MLVTLERTLQKLAAGDPQTFEASLASIGRSVMSGRCPALFKHEIGFQVLDQDDENTRAVGVFGFRVGDRILYAPLFYRDGRVKGTEQLRDPKRNMTVPLSDNWVNKILTDRGDDPAEIISKSEMRGTSQPTLWQLKYPPSKYAADRAAADAAGTWVPEAGKSLAKAIGRSPSYPAVDVDLVKTAASDPETFRVFSDWVVRYPWFGDAVVRYHGREKVAAALAEVQNTKASFSHEPLRGVPKGRKKRAAVSVVRVREISLSTRPFGDIDYAPTELDELRAGGNVYHDRRHDSEKTKIVTWLSGNQASGEAIANPGETGIYKVLGADWDEHECAVLFPLIGWDKSREDGRCLVVRLKDDAHCYTHHNAVWTTGQAENTDYYNKWLEKLPGFGKKLPEDYMFAAVGPCRAQKTFATVPVVVTDAETGDAYESCGCAAGKGHDAPFWNKIPKLLPRRVTQAPWPARDRVETAPRRVRLWDKPGMPFLSGNCLYIPTDAKIVKVGDEELKLAVGSDPDHFLDRAKKAMVAGAKTLSLGSGSRGYFADDPRTGRRQYWDYPQNLEADLVERHGFKVADAKEVVRRLEKDKTVAVAVKYAASYEQPGLSNDWPNAPATDYEMSVNPGSFADDIVPTETSSSLPLVIQDLLQATNTGERYRPYPVSAGVQGTMEGVGNSPGAASGFGPDDSGREATGPSDKDLSTVSRAAETGRKELFDTAALAALVKHTRIQRLLDRVTPLISKTVTGLADVLAHIAWNTEEWSEQFGESEIGPIEDQARDLFEGLGDLLLTLQEKQVDDPRDHGILPREFAGDGADDKN